MSRFDFNEEELMTTRKLLDAGIYAGRVKNWAVTNKDGQSYITIREVQKFNSVTRKSEKTGVFQLAGNIRFAVELTSKKAISTLQVDEPLVFGGNIQLNFTENGNLAGDNVVFSKTLIALGLASDNDGKLDCPIWKDCVPVYDEVEEVPENLDERIKTLPNVLELLTAINYWTARFELLFEHLENLPVLANIIQEAHYKTKELQNVIDSGAFGTKVAILPYTEDAEFDLDV